MSCTNHPDREVRALGLCKSCYKKKWRQDNREKFNTSCRKAYARDPEKYHARHRKYVAKNRAKISLYRKRYNLTYVRKPWGGDMLRNALSYDAMGNLAPSDNLTPYKILVMKEDYLAAA